MKVLIIGSRIPFPLHDGGAIATFNLLRGLCDIGIETTYISLNTNKHFVDESTLKKEFGFLKSIIPYKIDTSIKARKGLSLAQVINTTSKTIPTKRMMNDMVDMMRTKDIKIMGAILRYATLLVNGFYLCLAY